VGTSRLCKYKTAIVLVFSLVDKRILFRNFFLRKQILGIRMPSKRLKSNDRNKRFFGTATIISDRLLNLVIQLVSFGLIAHFELGTSLLKQL